MTGRALIKTATDWVPYIGGGDHVQLPTVPVTGVGMNYPTAGLNVTGDVYAEVFVDPAVGATAVAVQVGHIDCKTYACTRVGTSNIWRMTVPWHSGLNLYDRTTPLVADYAFWLRGWVTTPAGVVTSDYVQCFSNNYPVVGATPAWDASNAFSAVPDDDLPGWLAKFDQVYGWMNNPDDNSPANNTNGAPTTAIVNAPTASGRMVRVSMRDDHTTADQANAGLRWQAQTPATLRDGDIAWVGYSLRVPVSLSTAKGTVGFPIPTSSHICVSQCMGRESGKPSPEDYGLGIRYMSHARILTIESSTGRYIGTSDMKREYFNTDQTDRGHGEPALAVEIPFNRGAVTDVVWGMGISKDCRKGWLEFQYRLGPGPLIRWEFFGIPGNYRIPCAMIARDGLGQRIDLNMYRTRGKWVQVTIDFGQIVIGSSAAAVDPHSYG